MSPQRRTALVSVVAACVLISLKLVTGLASGSLGLVSEAIHPGTDLVAALLTLFPLGVSGGPRGLRGGGDPRPRTPVHLVPLACGARRLRGTERRPGLVRDPRRVDRDRDRRQPDDSFAARVPPVRQPRPRLERAALRE